MNTGKPLTYPKIIETQDFASSTGTPTAFYSKRPVSLIPDGWRVTGPGWPDPSQQIVSFCYE
jgi:hypothetical protein